MQDLSKINQVNFQEIEIKKYSELDDSKKEKMILEIFDTMIVLELKNLLLKMLRRIKCQRI